MNNPRDVRSDGDTYPVLEIFTSIQSEGHRAGTLTRFLRLGGCNYNCSFCFGVKPGRHIPRIITSNCPNKRIDKVVAGDKLVTFDSAFNLVETTIMQVHRRKIEAWFEIVINGKMYFVTSEHPFFTTSGMKLAKDLIVGDQIYHATPRDKISFSKQGKYNPMKRPEVIKKSVAATDYAAIGAKISETIQRQKNDGVYVSTWDRLDKSTKDRIRSLNSRRMMGEGNPNWAGGPSMPNFHFLKGLCSDGSLETCKSCGKTKKLEVHHINGDHADDNWDNLTTICHSCHSKAHKRGYNFWALKRKDGRQLSVDVDIRAIQRNGVTVESIKYVDINSDIYYPSTRPNPLTVYNFTCEPYNTFLLDYMWVHNCDTPMDNYKMMTVDEICEQLFGKRKIPKTLLKNLVITGGEPMVHDLLPLLKGLQKFVGPGLFIAIESNGSRIKKVAEQQPEVMDLIDWLTVSPKLPLSGKLLREHANEVKYIVPDHEDYIDWQHPHVFVQPEFNNPESVERCLEWMRRFPNIRMSVQTHKYLNLR